MFSQMETLPLAYLLILMWVVCANVLAKLFGPILLKATSGWLHRILSRRVNLTLTGDKLETHLLEGELWHNLSRKILIDLLGDLERFPGNYALVRIPVASNPLSKAYRPVRYISGCPPDAV